MVKTKITLDDGRVRKIEDYLELVLSEQDMELRNRITIIG